jgi:hypothetical protein
MRPSLGERRKLSGLQRRLTPDAARHREYLRQVSTYVAESRAVAPRLAHDGHVGHITALELWRSHLFGRRYLVAYVEASWFHAVAPASDAMTSTLSGMNALPPLVIVPHRRRRPRSERFRAIIEHEFVHINQAILGALIPSPRGTPRQRLATLFFTRLRNEYEAHALQTVRWPQFLPPGLGLSLEHWCVLRAYTDALEGVFVAAWRRKLRPPHLKAFLNRFPRRLGWWFRKLGVDTTIVFWFRRHLVVHVSIALLNLARIHPGFAKSAVFQTGHSWVGSAASGLKQRRAEGADIRNVWIA